MITRLDSHAKGRLSGDQFNVYVANRLVVPKLVPDQFSEFAAGTLTLDLLTRQYIHENFEYQYLIVKASAEDLAPFRLAADAMHAAEIAFQEQGKGILVLTQGAGETVLFTGNKTFKQKPPIVTDI